jgi:hypothetical protein
MGEEVLIFILVIISLSLFVSMVGSVAQIPFIMSPIGSPVKIGLSHVGGVIGGVGNIILADSIRTLVHLGLETLLKPLPLLVSAIEIEYKLHDWLGEDLMEIELL